MSNNSIEVQEPYKSNRQVIREHIAAVERCVDVGRDSQELAAAIYNLASAHSCTEELVQWAVLRELKEKGESDDVTIFVTKSMNWDAM